jgi:hypothetical protein
MMMVKRFAYVATNGYRMDSFKSYNLRATARILEGKFRAPDYVKFIPSLSFLAPRNGDAYNKNFKMERVVVTANMLGYAH